MQKFKNILVVVNSDTEIKKNAAVIKAIALAKKNNGQLTFMEVISAPENMIREYKGIISSQQLIAISVEHKQQAFDSIVDELNTQGVDASAKVLAGRDFIEIIHEVIVGKYDLLIKMANLHSGNFDSSDFHLMRKCPQPVWLINREKEAQCHRILAAVDLNLEEHDEGKALNTMIMDLATSLATWHQCELHVLSCWSLYGEDSMRHSGFLKVSEEKIEEMLQQELTINKRYLDSLVERYKSVPLTAHLLKTSAKSGIPDFVHQHKIDVVVMGTVGRTGIPGLLIGNTAETVLQSIDSSVITLKPAGFESPIK